MLNAVLIVVAACNRIMCICIIVISVCVTGMSIRGYTCFDGCYWCFVLVLSHTSFSTSCCCSADTDAVALILRLLNWCVFLAVIVEFLNE